MICRVAINLFVFFSKEHKSHSPTCNFILLKKPVEELTVEEILKLQKERQKFHIVSSTWLCKALGYAALYIITDVSL